MTDLLICDRCNKLYVRQNNEWRDTPLWCLLNGNWPWHFKRAGYTTAGQVYDATPEALARSIDNVGPKRAVKLHQTIVDYAKIREAGHKCVVVKGHEDPIAEMTPSVWDALLTVAALAAVGLIGTLTIWWLLQ